MRSTTVVVVWGYSDAPVSNFFREAPDAGLSAQHFAVRCGLEVRHEPFWVKEITLPLGVSAALQRVWQEAQNDPAVAGWQELADRY